MSDILDRLRGKYPVGPILPSGQPEFGWREFYGPERPMPGINAEAAAEIASLRDRLAKAEAELERTKFERRLAVASIAEELDRAVAECRAGRRARDLAAECLNDSAGCSVCGDANALYEAAIASNPLPEAPSAGNEAEGTR